MYDDYDDTCICDICSQEMSEDEANACNCGLVACSCCWDSEKEVCDSCNPPDDESLCF